MKRVDNILVSIIIPVYNAEEYVEECLKSILKQTYNYFEVIIVNDFSTDRSLEICSKYEKENDRFKIVNLEQNMGVSHARNVALSYAKGEYVVFVDSDDYIEYDYLEKMLNGVQGFDLAVCGFKRFGNNKDRDVKLEEDGEIDKKSCLYHTLCTNVIGGYPFNKIYRKKILEEQVFDTTISIGEDMLFNIEYMDKCKRIRYIPEVLYYYRCNPNSAMQKNYIERSYNHKVMSNLEASLKIRKIFHNQRSKEVEEYISYRIVRNGIWILLQMIVANQYVKEDAFCIKENVNNEYKKFKNINKGNLMQSIVAKMIGISPFLVYKLGVIGVKIFPGITKKILA